MTDKSVNYSNRGIVLTQPDMKTNMLTFILRVMLSWNKTSLCCNNKVSCKCCYSVGLSSATFEQTNEQTVGRTDRSYVKTHACIIIIIWIICLFVIICAYIVQYSCTRKHHYTFFILTFLETIWVKVSFTDPKFLYEVRKLTSHSSPLFFFLLWWQIATCGGVFYRL